MNNALPFLRSRLFDILFFAFALPISALGYLCALFHAQGALRHIARFWCHGNALLERTLLGIKTDMRGRENLPPGPCIIAAAHQSMWETLKLPIWFPDCAIIVKQQLVELPLWGRALRVYGSIPVARNRQTADLTRTLDEATQAAASGSQLVLFPHGTRVPPGETRPLQRGVALFYQHLNLPVVPLQLDSGTYWPRGFSIKKPGTIRVQLLPAIPPGLPRHEFLARLQAVLDSPPSF